MSFLETGFQISRVPPHRPENKVLIVGSIFATKLYISQFITLAWRFPVHENTMTHSCVATDSNGFVGRKIR